MTAPAPVDAPLHEQVAFLGELLAANRPLTSLLHRLVSLDLPGWYLGAGAVTQTVWNALHGFDPLHGIKDVDVVYFDAADLSPGAEKGIEVAVAALASESGLAAEVDVKNQARVHLWYPERFGRSVEPYRSTEEAISTWPSTASAIGVRITADGQLVVSAPWGLRDLFGLVVRPNKVLVSEEVFRAKADRWASVWPQLQVVDW